MKSVSAAKKKIFKVICRKSSDSNFVYFSRPPVKKEIKKFVPEPYWLIKALLDGEIEADHVDGKNI